MNEVIKQSFLSDLFGREIYDGIKGHAKRIIVIGSCILLLLYGLSLLVHWSFICTLLRFVTGPSLLFGIYLIALIFVLDIEVEVGEELKGYWQKAKKPTMPLIYKLTLVWGIILLALGIAAMYYSNKYRKHYAFECETFLVDKELGIYHLYEDCEKIEESNGDFVKMKGYEAEKNGYVFCEWCAGTLEYYEDYQYESMYRRR